MSSEVTIIDFYAEWCAPCKMMEQTLNRTQSRFPEVKVVKINVDKFKELKEAYNIKSLPTLIFKDSEGNIVDKKIGFLSEKDVNDIIRSIQEKEGGVEDGSN